MRKLYDEFQLRIGKTQGRQYRVRVVDCPAGERGEEMFRLDPTNLTGSGEILRGEDDPRHLRLASREPGEIERELGALLFRKVFSRSILSAFEKSLVHSRVSGRPLRVELQLDEVPELVRLPWELLYDASRREFLALSQATPLVRFLAAPGPPIASFLAAGRLRILVALASPEGLPPLDVEREWRQIHEALGASIKARRIVLKEVRHASLDRLRGHLNSGHWDVLHFVGHGAFGGNDGELYLEDESGKVDSVSEHRLRAQLQARGLQLVVLNVCEGGVSSPTDAWSGLAQGLARAGIPAVVAMQQPVSDRAAIAFASQLYEGLARGKTLEAALTESRLGLQSASAGTEWAIPVLYMRSPSGGSLDPPAVWRRLVSRASAAGATFARYTEEQGSRLRRVPAWASLAAMLLLAAAGIGVERWRSEEDHRVAGPAGPARSSPPADAPRAVSKTVEPDPSPVVPPSKEESRSAPLEARHLPMPTALGPCASLRILGMKFVNIKSGSFTKVIGSTSREVKVPGPLCMGAYEVTQAQWRKVTRESPSRFKGDSLPVERVNWLDLEEFLSSLNKQLTTAQCRLPTEAEAEYAARAGGATLQNLGNDLSQIRKIANCGQAFQEPRPVGSFPPNAWGLFDMDGNVSEWVDSQQPSTERRMIRGGSWHLVPSSCRVDQEKEIAATTRRFDIGLRLVCERK